MSTHEREPIGVIGTGYVGLVTAAGFAELGSDVYCIDIDAAKIQGLKDGPDPDLGAGPRPSSSSATAAACTSPPTSPTRSSTRACCSWPSARRPPTPGDADLSAVHAVVAAMPPSDRHALVMKSTVPCGTGDHIKRVFREQGKEGFRYVSCPEFLKEGSAVKDFLEPDRVVIGDDGDWAGEAVAELYAPLDAPLVRTDIKSAEMVKLASNAFLATKISFINEIANVCEETGADVVEVARGMGLDDRIGPKFLQAGIGFGGSCFPKDVSALKQLAGNSGYHFQLLNAVIEVNELQKRRVMSKLAEAPRHARGQGDRAARARLQAEHRRHARGLLARALRAAAGRGREGARLRPGGRGGGAQADLRAWTSSPPPRRPSRAPTPSCSSPSGPSSASSTSRAVAESMRGTLLVDGRNFLDPDAVHGRRADLRGRRAPERRRAPRGRGGRGLMQALILAGGEGTRLRPLTSTVPKPVVPLVDRPFIAFMLDWLRGHGVEDIVISCGHMAAGVRNVLGDGSAFGVRLRYVEEPQPLGTGGALKYAESLLDDRFFMLNGDVLTDIDLTAQIAQHERTGRAGDARADAGRGPVELRARAHRRRRPRHGVRREAGRRPDRHAQHLGRRLRARALGARPARARPARLDRARRLPAARRQRPLRLRLATTTGSTSGRPSATSRRPSTSSRARSAPAFAERAGDGYLVVEQSVENRGPHHPVRARRERLRDRRRRARRRPRRARARRDGRRRTRRSSARSSCAAPRSARTARLRGCIVGGGVRIGDNTHVEGLSVLGEGVTIGADNVIANGARIFPGVELPDGAIQF